MQQAPAHSYSPTHLTSLLPAAVCLLPQVEELTHVPHVSRELMLVKVSCTAQQRGELVSLASVSRGPALPRHAMPG